MGPLLYPMSCMGCHSPRGRGSAPRATVKHQEGTGPSAPQADPGPIACSPRAGADSGCLAVPPAPAIFSSAVTNSCSQLHSLCVLSLLLLSLSAQLLSHDAVLATSSPRSAQKTPPACLPPRPRLRAAAPRVRAQHPTGPRSPARHRWCYPNAWGSHTRSLPPLVSGELLLLLAGLITLVYLSSFTVLKLNVCSSFSPIP